MPGYLLHQNDIVQCAHLGRVIPTSPTPRVKVSGNMAILFTDIHQVAGCPILSPCVTAKYVSSATRVTSGGVPVLLFDSQAVCSPTGASVQTITTQMRVKGV